jgi:hypothetical protein
MHYPDRWIRFVDFDEATVYGLAGGLNRRALSALAYEIAWVGVWRK